MGSTPLFICYYNDAGMGKFNDRNLIDRVLLFEG